MKTAEEKAEEVCRKLKLPTDGPAFVAIRRAIKEQDRDTRHACAEAVVLSNNNDEFDELLHVASNACMNVKAV